MTQTIMILGCNGFVGSNLVRKVLYQKDPNFNYVGVDLCENPNTLNNIYVNKSYQFHVADIANSHVMDVIFDMHKPDAVIHLAARSFVDDAIKDPSPFIHSNVLGTQTIIDKCLKFKVKKIVYMNTDECMGELGKDEKPWDESATFNPRNTYSATKAAGEFLIKAAANTHGLKFNSLRSCNIFGHRQQQRNFIPKVIKNIIAGTKMPIYTPGSQIRQWIYVEDVCSALLKVLHEGKDNEIYNVSNDWEITNLELFHEIAKLMGKEDITNLYSFVQDRLGHDFRYALNSFKIREELNWKPTFKFKNALANTVQWYLNNQWVFR